MKLNKIGLFAIISLLCCTLLGCTVQVGEKEEKQSFIQQLTTDTKIMTLDNLYSQDEAKFKDTISINGNEYTLTNVTIENTIINNRQITLMETVDYGYQTYTPKPDETVTVQYYDNKQKVTADQSFDIGSVNLSGIDTASGEVLTFDLPFISQAQTEPWKWRSDFVAPMTFYNYNSAYYLLSEGVYVPYNNTVPEIKGFEQAYLDYLKLSNKSYIIESAEWISDVYYNDQGILCRDANVKGQRLTAHYTAYYQATVSLPDVSGYKAIATYERPYYVNVAVAGGATATAVTVAIVVFFRRRKSIMISYEVENENEVQENDKKVFPKYNDGKYAIDLDLILPEHEKLLIIKGEGKLKIDTDLEIFYKNELLQTIEITDDDRVIFEIDFEK